MSRDWQSPVSWDTLVARDTLLRQLRRFFAERGIIEVETPIIARYGVPDVYLASIEAVTAAGTRYLQTSPEYALKRLLATHGQPVFEIARVFRDAEQGRQHNSEFSLLEWYRPHLSLPQLVQETLALLAVCGVSEAAQLYTYTALFNDAFSVDHRDLSHQQLAGLAHQQGVAEHIADHGDSASRADYLDALFSQLIEPRLTGVSVVSDYPACQAALARVNEEDLAERSEVFVGGTELANGYAELRDATQLRSRFTQSNAARQRRGLTIMDIDERLLAALPEMPPTSGIALGVDRLLMHVVGANAIEQVIAFPDSHC